MKDQNSVMLLWDLATGAEVGEGNIFLWRSFSQNPTISSIPKIIEENSTSLRNKLVSWIHDVAIADLGGDSLLSLLTCFMIVFSCFTTVLRCLVLCCLVLCLCCAVLC